MTAPLNTRGIDAELAQWAKDAAKARGISMITYLERLIRLHQRMAGLSTKGPLAKSVLAEYGLQEVAK